MCLVAQILEHSDFELCADASLGSEKGFREVEILDGVVQSVVRVYVLFDWPQRPCSYGSPVRAIRVFVWREVAPRHAEQVFLWRKGFVKVINF
jgi:hypothetical protein